MDLDLVTVLRLAASYYAWRAATLAWLMQQDGGATPGQTSRPAANPAGREPPP